MHLSGIFIHPLKSCAPLALGHAVVEPMGLAHDRRWMVVDADGKALTGRELPRLTQVRAVPDGDGLQLDAPGMGTLRIAAPATAATAVRVFSSPLSARRAGEPADAWLGTFLQHAVRLVHMDAGVDRVLHAPHARPGDIVSMADGAPLLLVSQASLDGLNARLAAPVTMQRFRPNLVVDGTQAHVEDAWRAIRIGDVEFEIAEPCIRCVFTTVDPLRGARDPTGEPLRTLLDYRRTGHGIAFGQLLIPRSAGTVRLGDAVTVLAGAT